MGVREKFEKAWGVNLPSKRGLDSPGMVEAIYDGKVKALYLAGEDMIPADANAAVVAGAFERLDLFVVQDIFITETCGYADVVFSALAGTGEGRHIHQYRAAHSAFLPRDPRRTRDLRSMRAVLTRLLPWPERDTVLVQPPAAYVF